MKSHTTKPGASRDAEPTQFYRANAASHLHGRKHGNSGGVMTPGSNKPVN